MTNCFKSKHTSPSFYMLCNMQCFSFALHVLIFTHFKCNMVYSGTLPQQIYWQERGNKLPICLNFNLVQYIIYNCLITLWLVGRCEIFLWSMDNCKCISNVRFLFFGGIFWLVFKMYYNLLVFCDLWHKCQCLCHFKFSENAIKIILCFTYVIKEYDPGPS